MTELPFPWGGYRPVHDVETAGELILWFSRPPSAAERRKIQAGRPKLLMRPAWQSSLLMLETAIDDIAADPESFVRAQAQWVEQAHATVPISFALGPWVYDADDTTEAIRDALVEAAARELSLCATWPGDQSTITDCARAQRGVLAFAQAAGLSPSAPAYLRVLEALELRDADPLLQLSFSMREAELISLVHSLPHTTQLLFYGHPTLGPPRLIAMEDPVSFIRDQYDACATPHLPWATDLLLVLAHNLSLVRHKPDPTAPMRFAISLFEHGLAKSPGPRPRDEAALDKLRKKLARKIKRTS